MKTMSTLCCATALVAGLLAGCSEPSTTAAPQVETPDAMATTPPAATPTPGPVAPAPNSPAASFATSPKPGWIVRANCHMGACTWDRFDQVERGGSESAPTYRLRITQGESQHAGEYPAGPDGVDITWDGASVQAAVACSRTAPHASVGDQGEALKLNPQGVAGVSQALANLYFSVCHGEYGNDAELAAKHGYDLR